MQTLPRLLLAATGIYWGGLVFILVDSCFGAKNCVSDGSEGLLWATAAALPYVLPALVSERPKGVAVLVQASSAAALLIFVLVFGARGSLWSVSALIVSSKWTDWGWVLTSGLPATLLLLSLLTLTGTLLSGLRK